MVNLVRALHLLEAILDHGTSQLADLAETAAIPKSTAHRLLQTMVTEGWVARSDADNSYSAGHKTLRLGGVARSRSTLLRVCRPVVDALVDATDLTVHVGVLAGRELLYLYGVEPNEGLRLGALTGRRGTPYSSALGKVLLAYADERVVRSVFSGRVRRYTDNTIVTAEEFLSAAQTIRSLGYASTWGERYSDVRAAAAPIRDDGGQVVAAVSAAGSAARLGPELLLKTAGLVRDAAYEISTRLGDVSDKPGPVVPDPRWWPRTEVAS